TSSSTTTSNEGTAQTGQSTGSASSSDLNNVGSGQNVQNPGQANPAVPGTSPDQPVPGQSQPPCTDPGSTQVGPFVISLGGAYDPGCGRNNILSELGFDLAMLLLGLAEQSGRHTPGTPNIWGNAAPPIGFSTGNITAFPNSTVEVITAPISSPGNDAGG